MTRSVRVEGKRCHDRDATTLACTFGLVLSSRPNARRDNDRGAKKIRRGGNNEERASQPSRVAEGIEGGGGRDGIVACGHRWCAGGHAEAQMLVVAAERSEICQRPGLL